MRGRGFLVDLNELLLSAPRVRVYLAGGVKEGLGSKLVLGILSPVFLFLHDDLLKIFVLNF